jgi:hypothetical protein
VLEAWPMQITATPERLGPDALWFQKSTRSPTAGA